MSARVEELAEYMVMKWKVNVCQCLPEVFTSNNVFISTFSEGKAPSTTKPFVILPEFVTFFSTVS